MKKQSKTIGSMIEREAVADPLKARRLLARAYSFVRAGGMNGKYDDLGDTYSFMSGSIAGTIADSLRTPDQAVMVNTFMPCELLHAMDIIPMFPEGLSSYLACTGCQNVFAEAAESADVPETFCSYHKTMIGVAETGVMPAPMMIANTTLACDANHLSFRRLADYYGCPHTVIDIPVSSDEDAVIYVADQLRSLARTLEDVSGRKLDEKVLIETVARTGRTAEYLKKYLSLRGEVSMPVTMSGEMSTMIASHVMLGRPESEEYFERLLHCTEKAPRRDGRKTRIFWMHTFPNWQDSMKTILEKGNCEIVGADVCVDSLSKVDPLHPYESMARRVVESISNGSSMNRIDAVIRAAKAARADGVILFAHWGCKQTLGLSQLAKQALEAEGLPTLVLDGDGCDNRNVADGQMITRVNAFVEQLEGGMSA